MDSRLYPAAGTQAVPASSIKRQPEDEEPSLTMNSGPHKRQATEGPISEGQASLSRTLSEVTVEGLQGKGPAELISVILQMQSSHEQQVADLQSQYAVVSRQLAQLTSILDSHFASQLAAIQSVQQDLISTRPSVSTSRVNVANGTVAHIPSPLSVSTPSQPIPVPPTLPGLVVAPPRPHSGLVTPTPRRDRLETPPYAMFSPSQARVTMSPDGSHDKTELTVIPASVPDQPPTVTPSRLDTVAEVWEEFHYGRNGNPSVEALEIRWGPRWRRDSKVQRWYARRKLIADKIRQYIADGVDEQTAVGELQAMRRTRTLNWLSRELEDQRKETKKQWKAARQAAIANKNAMFGPGAAPGGLA